MSSVITYQELCSGFVETACLGRIELAYGRGWQVTDIPPDVANKLEVGLSSNPFNPPAPSTSSNTPEIPGGSFPFPMLAIGVIALCTWGAEQVSKRGQASRQQRAISGGHIRQASISAAPPKSEPVEPGVMNPDSTRVQPGSGSKPGGLDTAKVHAGSGFTEPSPWGMTEADRYAYQQDNTGSTLTTADCWSVLAECTFVEFKKRVNAGSLDPVAIKESGVGGPAGLIACNEWFRHGIDAQNKVCYAVFGTDGKGGTARATAATHLFKEYLADWKGENHGK